MNLTDAQKQTVKKWIADGLKLADIQKKISTEFGINPTYMEVRFLVDDLKVMPKDPDPPKAPTPPPAPAPAAPAAGPDDAAFDDEPEPAAPAPSPLDPTKPPGAGGKVSVVVDKIAIPGALVSGSVTFSDGVTAQWYLDEMGRLGMVPKTKGYRPPQADVQTFQIELQKQLQTMGF